MEKVPEKKPVANVETLLGCGCFQFFIFLCLQWTGFVQACNMLFMAFGKAMPAQWACLDDGGLSIGAYENGTRFDDKLQCEVINSVNGCQNFTWSGEFYSIVPHWQLVCGRVKYVYLIMTLQMAGALIGSPVAGQLSDSYGRKWTLLGALSLLLASGTASAFSPNWQTLGALRFLVGFSAGGCIITNHVFVMEFLTRKHRLWLSNIAGWSISYMLIVAVAYSTADWRQLAIVTNVIGIPALGVVLWVGESPRWLLQRGNIEEAEKQLRRVARFNRHVLDEEEVALVLNGSKLQKHETDKPTSTTGLQQLETDKVASLPTPEMAIISNEPPLPKLTARKYSYWHLFATRQLAVNTIILSATYFCISIISSGITFNVDKLSGSMFVNFAIMGGVRWASNLIVVGADLLIPKFGRRVGLVVPLFGICLCALAVTLTHLLGPNLPQLKTIVVFLSMAMAMLSPPIWIMVYLSNTELFPTPIRNIAHAFCATWNRLGGVVAPQILFLAHAWKPAPFAIFAGLSLIAGILFAIFIPETKGKPLPEKMPERKTSGSIFDHLRRRQSKLSGQYHENKDALSYHLVNGDDKKQKEVV